MLDSYMQHEDSRSNEPYQCSCGRAFAEVPMNVDSLGTDKGLHLHKVPAVYYQEYMLRICITSAYICYICGVSSLFCSASSIHEK